jgi:hypothetical protein
MKVLLLAATLLSLLSGSVAAQAGQVTIAGDVQGIDCNLPDVTQTVISYYVVHLFTAGATAVQFSAPKPACLLAVYLSDSPVFPVTIGNSQTGVAVGYGACLASPIHVLTLTYFAQGLTPSCCCYRAFPDPQIQSSMVEVVDCNNQLLFGTAGFGVVNADDTCLTGGMVTCECLEPIGAERSTWGRVKATFAD